MKTPKIKPIDEVVTIKTSYRVELFGRDIVALLQSQGTDIPDGTRVYVNVPGGGDWSNEELEIGAGSPLVLTWEEVHS